MMLQKHNPKWSRNPNQPYRIPIVGGSGSAKINELLNLINYQPDSDTVSL